MKAFLMYRDRDFDPGQLLARRERELRYRNADQKALGLEQRLPWNEAALRQDLGLDILFATMAQGDSFLFEVAKVAMLTSLTDLSTILYRQDIFADCLDNEQVIREMYQVLLAALEGERKNYWSSFGRYPSGTLHRAVEVLQVFVVALKALRRLADRHADRFRSEGFTALSAMLRRELSDGYFAEVEQHLGRLKFRKGVLISAKLGQGNKGTDYALRRPHDNKRNWIERLLAEKPPSYTFQLHPRDESGAHALSALTDRGVNLVANALAQSTDHILSFFQMLRTELAFYIGCLNLRAELARLGEPTCRPTPEPMESKTLLHAELYDVALALNAKQKVVGNDLAGGPKRLVIVTGANTGGKSTFLRSVGIAYLMMQAGMFAPAQAFSAGVRDGIVTHYKRQEDTQMESGKWDEELGRMSAIVDHLRPHALLLFNESFASTNEREGSEIARQVVKALLEKHVSVVFVTHLYHFAHGIFAEQWDGTVFLRAERRADGTRPFKLIEGNPLQTSYGEDLYQRIFAMDKVQSARSGGSANMLS